MSVFNPGVPSQQFADVPQVSNYNVREIVQTDKVKLKEYSDALGIVGYQVWLPANVDGAEIWVGRGDENKKEGRENVPVVSAQTVEDPAAIISRDQLKLVREGRRYVLYNNNPDPLRKTAVQVYDDRDQRFLFKESLGISDVRSIQKVSFIRFGVADVRLSVAVVEKNENNDENTFFINLSHPDFKDDEIVKQFAQGEVKYQPQATGALTESSALIKGLTMKVWKKVEAIQSHS